MPIAVVDDERFDGHRAVEMHPERPERLVAARAGLKRAVAPDELVRVAVRPVSDEEVLRVHSESHLRGLRDALSAGFDAHRRDPLAQLELDADCFGAMTTALLEHVEEAGHGRLALFLEGGYDLDAIEDSVGSVAKAGL
jgi:acetoin utilization deacetylase AcuC-like enzyme